MHIQLEVVMMLCGPVDPAKMETISIFLQGSQRIQIGCPDTLNLFEF